VLPEGGISFLEGKGINIVIRPKYRPLKRVSRNYAIGGNGKK
jgi:hypothetical protein